MDSTEPILETFYNHATGKTIVRELTAEEIAALLEPTPLEGTDETPSAD
jgi:hypothetical protein